MDREDGGRMRHEIGERGVRQCGQGRDFSRAEKGNRNCFHGIDLNNKVCVIRVKRRMIFLTVNLC